MNSMGSDLCPEEKNTKVSENLILEDCTSSKPKGLSTYIRAMLGSRTNERKNIGAYILYDFVLTYPGHGPSTSRAQP